MRTTNDAADKAQRRAKASATRYLVGAALSLAVGILSALLVERYISAAGCTFCAVIFFQRFLDRRHELRGLRGESASEPPPSVAGDD
ncbi:hypothetical protein [Candidatus Poriferisodalis sp.]|uniref:hypothetical protein n=1 Tax=Candidatus Poriferisodalis sp. TaxID=3101277 RepID=UPI003B5955B4